MTALELCRVSKVYGQGAAEVHALRDIDLTVEPGALVAVMGPSGSGKSTLLTIAGSLEDPTSGEVLVGGIALAGMSRNDKARLRRRSIGYVFQDWAWPTRQPGTLTSCPAASASGWRSPVRSSGSGGCC